MKICTFFRRSIVLVGFGTLITGIWPLAAAAAAPLPIKDGTYRARFVAQSVHDPITVAAGQEKQVIISFKNSGTADWSGRGPNFVSVYTINPSYRSSVFAASNWLAKSQPARLSNPQVKPGQVGEFAVTLKAPDKPGEYQEEFNLAAENKTWIQGSYFFLKIKVVPAKAAAAKKTVAKAAADEEEHSGNSAVPGGEDDRAESDYAANLVAFSGRAVGGQGGEKINFIVRYLNTGTRQWKKISWIEAGSRTVGVATGRVTLADHSWNNDRTITVVESLVDPTKPLEIPFSFRLPQHSGSYTARFQLVADGHTVAGATLELPLMVTADAPLHYQEPVFDRPRPLIAEPNIRVGLYQAEEPVLFESNFEYRVFAGANEIGTLPPGEVGTMRFAEGKHLFSSATLATESAEFIRLVPFDPAHYFTLPTYQRRVDWKGNKNFNVYRGSMEFRFSPKKKVPYVINDLPLDLYVAGIAETSNGAAMEYIKALLVAARSYGFYHINNGVPKDQRTFDVYATTADQLYLGYNSESLMPRVVQAAEATAGEMVTYQGSPVVTPYFGNSDGRTRGWKEVWGGSDKPWLTSVEAMYDKGKKMWGHGVGMSARDASERAQKDGWTYDQLLKHYYTGTEVEKIY